MIMQQTEVKEKLHTVTSEKKNLEKTLVTRKQQRDVLSWEEMLHNSCKHGYQEKLIVDLLALFREDIDIKNQCKSQFSPTSREN